jgi:hypothetical protein
MAHALLDTVLVEQFLVTYVWIFGIDVQATAVLNVGNHINATF